MSVAEPRGEASTKIDGRPWSDPAPPAGRGFPIHYGIDLLPENRSG